MKSQPVDKKSDESVGVSSYIDVLHAALTIKKANCVLKETELGCSSRDNRQGPIPGSLTNLNQGTDQPLAAMGEGRPRRWQRPGSLARSAASAAGIPREDGGGWARIPRARSLELG